MPIALYGCKIWGPLSKLDYTKWDKHPIESLHAEFIRNILRVQRKTPTNACRAELGRFPLALNIQKRSLKFWLHLKSSPENTIKFQAITTQEVSPETSPLCQLVLKLTNTPTHPSQTSTASQNHIKVKQIMNQSKKNYLEHWDDQTKSQSKLECYLSLKRDYELAEYLSTVRDTRQRQILTKYRLSDHSLAVEKGRYKQAWLPREQRLCGHCTTGEVETEMHFLLYCPKFEQIRKGYFLQFSNKIANFSSLKDCDKLAQLLGEGLAAPLAAKYVAACHDMRDRESDTSPQCPT